jgi:hypothetical protein
MNAQSDNTGPKGPRGWWASPPRSGLRLIIAPWEYRRLRGFARVRIACAFVLVGVGLVTLNVGGHDERTYAWTVAFLLAAVAQFRFAFWELNIARSESSES